MLHTGSPGRISPREYGYGSGVTCWRRLRSWRQAGAWEALHQQPLRKLSAAGKIDWLRAAADASHLRALAITLTGGNRNDVTQLIRLLEYLHARPVKGKPGRPRRKPDRLLADRGYDHDKYRRLLWDRGIKPLIAKRGVEHGSHLGRERWVVERDRAHSSLPIAGHAAGSVVPGQPRMSTVVGTGYLCRSPLVEEHE